MNNYFKSIYKLEGDVQEEILYVLDSNFLSYAVQSIKSSEKFFKSIEQIKDSLYVPFVVYMETIHNLKSHIKETENVIEDISKIYENIDIPINSNVLIDNIKNNNFNENINLEYFFEGILLLNGIDSKFSNITVLNNFIKSKNINLLEFVKSKIGFNSNNLDSIIYNLLIIRGLLNLEIYDDFIRKIYVRFLL